MIEKAIYIPVPKIVYGLDPSVRLLIKSVIVMTIFSSSPWARASPAVYVNAEGGQVEYNMGTTEQQQGRGWYTEPGSPNQQFSLGFKQAERKSGNPIQVAFIQTTPEEHFKGEAALELKVIANDPVDPRSTATYKVSFDISSGDLVYVDKPQDWYNAFAMKIDSQDFVLPTTTSVLFQQWWQGSPYHPPVSMELFNPQQALANGFTNIGAKGNFAILLRDINHNPGGANDKGLPRVFDLGPIVTGEWIEWVVGIRPDSTGKVGAVHVWKNSRKMLTLSPTVVGFSQASGEAIGNKSMWVNLCIYRGPGQNSQRIFFDEIKLTNEINDVVFPNADPDGDGISNFLEYAYGSDPNVNDPSVAPVIGKLRVAGVDYRSFSYRKNRLAGDLTYIVEISSDLKSWTTNVITVSETDNGNGTNTVLVRDNQRISFSKKRFIRLRVENITP